MIDGQTNLDRQYGEGLEPEEDEEVDDGAS